MGTILIELEELPDLASRLNRIKMKAEELAQFPDNWLHPLGSVVSDIEFFILGAVKRTSSLAEGFCAMVETKNTLSAAALLRLQIDTAMRVHGLSLVEDAEAAGEALMAGQQFNRLISRDGKRLRDAFLHECLSKKHPWVSKAYLDASSYVHLSGDHMKTSISATIGGMVFFNLRGTEPKRLDEQYYHLTDTFFVATDLTATVIKEFAAAHPGPTRRLHGWRDK